MGDTVTLWLVRWTPGREVWVQAQASPPRSKNGYRRITMEGVGVGGNHEHEGVTSVRRWMKYWGGGGDHLAEVQTLPWKFTS